MPENKAKLMVGERFVPSDECRMINELKEISIHRSERGPRRGTSHAGNSCS